MGVDRDQFIFPESSNYPGEKSKVTNSDSQSGNDSNDQTGNGSKIDKYGQEVKRSSPCSALEGTFGRNVGNGVDERRSCAELEKGCGYNGNDMRNKMENEVLKFRYHS